MHLDQAIALYDSRPSSRPLAMRVGLDAGVVTLGYRSHALWSLGFPDAARADAERAVALARETGHAAALMHALSHMSDLPQTLCGNAVAASAHLAQEQIHFGRRKRFPVLESVWNDEPEVPSSAWSAGLLTQSRF